MTFLHAMPPADGSPGSTGGHNISATPCAALLSTPDSLAADAVRAELSEVPEHPAAGVLGYRLGRRAAPAAGPDETAPAEGTSRAGPR